MERVKRRDIEGEKENGGRRKKRRMYGEKRGIDMWQTMMRWKIERESKKEKQRKDVEEG